jgi:hypothetical protein
MRHQHLGRNPPYSQLRKTGRLGIYFTNNFDNYFSVFVPERSRQGTNPLSQFLYQPGHLLVPKVKIIVKIMV